VNVAQAVRELLVFLASPGDVEAERAAVREVASRVNANFEDRGVRVRVVGWEQVRPELGRPQELINPLVYKCDVFIGLLNRRWGSETGLYSSGFEEEFEVALQRRQSGGTPGIGMFFAELPAEALDDPGAQLQAVMSFQDRVRTEKIGLYKQYGSTDHLATEVLDFLTGHALDLASNVRDEASGDVGGGPAGNADPDGSERDRSASAPPQLVDDTAQTGDDATVTVPAETNDATRQIAHALRGLATVFETPAGGLGANAERDRVTLVGTAFAVDERLLGTHHVNRLYQRRDDLKLANGEMWTWLRTYFADRHADRGNRTVPVWGLFHPLQENGGDFGDDLVRVAANDDIRVSRGALAFMTEHRVRPPGLWAAGPDEQEEDEAEQGPEGPPDGPEDGQAVNDAAEDGSSGGDGVPTPFEEAISTWVRIYGQLPGVGVAANYMIAVAAEDDLDLLDGLAADNELGDSSKAVVEAIAACLRGDAKPLAMFAPSRYADGVDALVDQIVAIVPDLGDTEWESLLNSRNPKLAVPAAIELIGLGRSAKDDLVAFLKLNDGKVDAALAEKAVSDSDLCADLLSLLRDSKQDLEDGDQRIARLLAVVLPREEGLEDLVDSEPSYRLAAWEALTIQDPGGMAAQAREVLDDRSEFLKEKVAPLLDEYESLAKHIIADGKRSACMLLAEVAEEDSAEDRSADLDRAIAELTREDFRTRHAALSAIVALVDETAVERLPVDLIDGYWVTRHTDELLASPLATLLATKWRTSSVSDLQSAAATWFIQQPERTDEELEEATYDNDVQMRMAAIDVIVSSWSRDQVLGLLERYDQQQRPYWYNVIAAMDEHLFGYAAIKATRDEPA